MIVRPKSFIISVNFEITEQSISRSQLTEEKMLSSI